MIEIECFEEVINDKTQILILGTAPSKESLQKKKYYQSSNNKFWGILSSVLGIQITKENYKDVLPKTNVGLWDTFRSVKGEDSKDKNREFGSINDFKEFFNKHPSIKFIIFNGNGKDKNKIKPYNEFIKNYKDFLEDREILTFILSSTSGSNANFNFEEKTKLWKDQLTLISKYVEKFK